MTKTMSKTSTDFLSNSAESFLAELLDPWNKYNLESVFLYYLNVAIPEVFHIKSTSEENYSKIMENIEISKAGGEILSKPISETCLQSHKTPTYFQERQNVNPSNYRPTSLLPLNSKIIENVVHRETNKFLSENKILYNYQSGSGANWSAKSFWHNEPLNLVRET